MNKTTRRLALAAALAMAAAATAIIYTTASTSAATPQQPPPTAEQIYTKLQTAGLPIDGLIIYDATTDPNHLLGRPNGYTSKAAFTDNRITSKNTSPGNVDLGGTIEVYPTHEDAQARADYIAKIEKAMPMLGTEYDYINGSTLIRVSSTLTPEQAAAYNTAAH